MRRCLGLRLDNRRCARVSNAEYCMYHGGQRCSWNAPLMHTPPIADAAVFDAQVRARVAADDMKGLVGLLSEHPHSPSHVARAQRLVQQLRATRGVLMYSDDAIDSLNPAPPVHIRLYTMGLARRADFEGLEDFLEDAAQARPYLSAYLRWLFFEYFAPVTAPFPPLPALAQMEALHSRKRRRVETAAPHNPRKVQTQLQAIQTQLRELQQQRDRLAADMRQQRVHHVINNQLAAAAPRDNHPALRELASLKHIIAVNFGTACVCACARARVRVSRSLT